MYIHIILRYGDEIIILKSLRLFNFKCFQDSLEIPLSKLTIFVGENDSGKTAILDALNIFFTNNRLDDSFYYKDQNEQKKEIIIQLQFELVDKESESIPVIIKSNNLTVKKCYSLDGDGSFDTYIHGIKFDEDELNATNNLNSTNAKKYCSEFGIEYTSLTDFKQKIKDFLKSNYESVSNTEDWVSVEWKKISEIFPSYERYDSSNMSNPITPVENVLKNLYKSFFYNFDENNVQTLKDDLILKKKEIEMEMNSKISDNLLEKIQKLNKKVKNIEGDFNINFAEGFKLDDFRIDFGDGLTSLKHIGNGSKSRLFLAITEWSKELNSQQNTIIKGYDEPDANLHYRAQKEIYYALSNLANENTNIQVIICTHSLSMIDRAPVSSIVQIVNNGHGSEVNTINCTDDENVKKFIESISYLSGIKNSSLFFERCFLIVEGVSEETSIPIFYYKLTNRTLIEDGIVLINLNNNACWSDYLKLLSNNKSKCTILFLDKDIQETKIKITKEKLIRLGFNDEFLENNVVLTNGNEIECDIPSDIICRCLNTNWPKIDDIPWSIDDIDIHRKDGKFSKKMIDAIHSQSKNDINKPILMKEIAEIMKYDEVRAIECIFQLVEKLTRIVD